MKPVIINLPDYSKSHWEFTPHVFMAQFLVIVSLGFGVWFGFSGATEVFVVCITITTPLAGLVSGLLIASGRVARKTDQAISDAAKLSAEQAERIRRLEEQVAALTAAQSTHQHAA